MEVCCTNCGMGRTIDSPRIAGACRGCGNTSWIDEEGIRESVARVMRRLYGEDAPVEHGLHAEPLRRGERLA
jgi:predicted ATP-dependent serine protease